MASRRKKPEPEPNEEDEEPYEKRQKLKAEAAKKQKQGTLDNFKASGSKEPESDDDDDDDDDELGLDFLNADKKVSKFSDALGGKKPEPKGKGKAKVAPACPAAPGLPRQLTARVGCRSPGLCAGDGVASHRLRRLGGQALEKDGGRAAVFAQGVLQTNLRSFLGATSSNERLATVLYCKS